MDIAAQNVNVSRKHAPEFKTTVASKLENLAKIAILIADVGKRYQVGNDDLFDIQTAVGEACTNVIQHAYALRTDRPVVVGCRVRNKEFVVRIRDFGEPFDLAAVSAPDLAAPLEERRVSGYGVFIIKHLMNRVKHQADEKRGNELLMVKKLVSASSAEPLVTVNSDLPHSFCHPAEGRKGVTVCELAGRIDASTALALTQALQELSGAARNKIVVVGRNLDFISAAGLSALLSYAQQIHGRRGSGVKFAELNRNVRRIFELVAFDCIFSVYASEQEAVSAFA